MIINDIANRVGRVLGMPSNDATKNDVAQAVLFRDEIVPVVYGLKPAQRNDHNENQGWSS